MLLPVDLASTESEVSTASAGVRLHAENFTESTDTDVGADVTEKSTLKKCYSGDVVVTFGEQWRQRGCKDSHHHRGRAHAECRS